MSKKIYDLAVKLGDKNWLNVGAVLQKDDGGKFIILERSFNPAGVPNPENKSSVILSMFEPKQKSDAAEKVSDAFNGEEVPF